MDHDSGFCSLFLVAAVAEVRSGLVRLGEVAAQRENCQRFWLQLLQLDPGRRGLPPVPVVGGGNRGPFGRKLKNEALILTLTHDCLSDLCFLSLSLTDHSGENDLLAGVAQQGQPVEHHGHSLRADSHHRCGNGFLVHRTIPQEPRLRVFRVPMRTIMIITNIMHTYLMHL